MLLRYYIVSILLIIGIFFAIRSLILALDTPHPSVMLVLTPTFALLILVSLFAALSISTFRNRKNSAK